MKDKIISCIDCGREFTLTVSGQEFFKSKGWEEPKRCKACRIKKKQQQT